MQPYLQHLNKRALIAPSFKVNTNDSFTRDNSQDFPPVIILSSVNDNKVEEKLVRVKGSKIVLNITVRMILLSLQSE